MTNLAAEAPLIVGGEEDTDRMSSVPFTGRDIVALEVLKCAVRRSQHHDDAEGDEIVRWAFRLADVFVQNSRAGWAKRERGEDGDHKGGQRSSNSS